MAAQKRKRPAKPCAHVDTHMVAYLACHVLPARDAVFWCADCGALIYRRNGSEENEQVAFPRVNRT